MGAGQSSPIFIGGHLRSGINLMRVILNRHPHIACGPEGDPRQWTVFQEFHRCLEEKWMPARLWKYNFGTSELDQALAAFLDHFFGRHQLAQGKQRWAEATPENILHIDYLFRVFPNARFIHMIRDPRDIYCLLAETMSEPLTVQEIAHRWVHCIEKGLAWKGDRSRYLAVCYEDLTEKPVDVMNTVLEFLDEPWCEGLLDARNDGRAVTAAPDAPGRVSGSSPGCWRRQLPAEDLRQLEYIAGPLMRQVGYQSVTTRDSADAGSSGPAEQSAL